MFWELISKIDSAPAIYDGEPDKLISYERLRRISESFSNQLPKGKKLAFLFADNSFRSIALYLACLQSGHVPLLLDPLLEASLTANLVEAYKPDWIWHPEARFHHSDYEINIVENESFFLAKHPGEKNLHPDLALLMSTSGTTGSPKCVRLSYKNLQANAKSISEYLQLDSGQCAITSLPIHYSFGLSILNSHLLSGASVAATNQALTTREFWDFFKAVSVTSLAGVPFTYQILEKLKIENLNIPSLKMLLQAGGRLNPDRVRHFLKIADKLSIQFYVMYGQTEATARISYVPPDKLERKAGSIGIPIPGGKLSIFQGKDEIKASNTDGELIYEGPNVMMGYSESSRDLEKGDELAGVLRTGDIAYRDADGYFYLTGRLKRFVKLFGLRVNLDDVEKLLECKTGKNVACLSNEDKLIVVIESGLAADEARAAECLEKIYAIHPSAYEVKHIAQFPLTTSKKISYEKIKEMVAA